MNEIRTCVVCGAALTDEDAKCMDNEFLCEHCYEEQTVACEHCGRRIWLDNAETDGHIYLCGRCFDDYYTSCEGCGRLINRDAAYYEDSDGDYPYCRDCYHQRSRRAIRAYNYKPDPLFYGSGDLFMGVEVEIDHGGENDENAREILDVANAKEDRIYCKHDGSLHNGFEIVSHPMDLQYHTEEMNWREVFAKARELHYTSHNAGTCGLHVHVGKSAFGKNVAERDEVIGRIVYFVEKHWAELVRFSRRTNETLERWAARYATISHTTKETYQKAKAKYMGRYVAINLENYETIEFRIFRGTLRYETFMATLQLVDEICCMAMVMPDSYLEQLSWSDFVKLIEVDKKPELIAYLKARQLYVNEPQLDEEEV